jgi:small-conductance mechanosensitive channel
MDAGGWWWWGYGTLTSGGRPVLLGIAAAANALPKKELENLTLSHKRDMAELNKRLEVRHHRRIVALQRGSITWAVVAAAAAVVVVVVVAMVAMVVVEAMAMAAVLAGERVGGAIVV